MRKSAARLARLEALVRVGCDHCRSWGPCVYEVGVRGPERPERCPDCGRFVEIRLLRRIVLIPPEDRLAASMERVSTPPTHGPPIRIRSLRAPPA